MLWAFDTFHMKTEGTTKCHVSFQIKVYSTRAIGESKCRSSQTLWPISFSLHMMSNVLFFSTAAAVIPSP